MSHTRTFSAIITSSTSNHPRIDIKIRKNVQGDGRHKTTNSTTFKRNNSPELAKSKVLPPHLDSLEDSKPSCKVPQPYQSGNTTVFSQETDKSVLGSAKDSSLGLPSLTSFNEEVEKSEDPAEVEELKVTVESLKGELKVSNEKVTIVEIFLYFETLWLLTIVFFF